MRSAKERDTSGISARGDPGRIRRTSATVSSQVLPSGIDTTRCRVGQNTRHTEPDRPGRAEVYPAGRQPGVAHALGVTNRGLDRAMFENELVWVLEYPADAEGKRCGCVFRQVCPFCERCPWVVHAMSHRSARVHGHIEPVPKPGWGLA